MVEKIRSLIIGARQQISNAGLVCLIARRGDIGVGLLLCIGDSGAGFLCVYATVYTMKSLLKKEQVQRRLPTLLFDYLYCRVTRLPVSGLGLTW